MNRWIRILYRGYSFASLPRHTPLLLCALTGQSSLRHGHEVVRRTMSQYKYADVSLTYTHTYIDDGDQDVDIGS